jgi:hypothetical protein
MLAEGILLLARAYAPIIDVTDADRPSRNGILEGFGEWQSTAAIERLVDRMPIDLLHIVLGPRLGIGHEWRSDDPRTAGS